MGLLTHRRKLLVVFGSPHSQGCTRRLLESFLECFRADRDWEIREVDAYELAARPCIDCKACAKKEGCAFNDLDELDRELRQSDLLAVASPVYNASFPAPVKAILDRTQRYFAARFSLGMRQPVKKHRDAVLLLTMGAQDEFGVEVAARQLERAFSVMNTTLRGCAVWGGTDRGEEGRGEAQQRARALALEIRAEM